MKTFEYWFDFGSPAAYLAWTQLPQLQADRQASVLYKPMLLGAFFKRQATIRPPPLPLRENTRLSTLHALPNAMVCRSTPTRTSPSTRSR